MRPLPKIQKTISFFDVLVIGFIGVLGLAFFFFFYRKPENITIRVKVTEQEPLYQQTNPKNWYASQFVTGDGEYDNLGRKSAEIIGVEQFSTDSKTKAVYVDLRIRGVYDSRSKQYSARGKTLSFGTPMRFSLAKVTFSGFVTEFPGSETEPGMKIGTATVIALDRYVEPALAQAIKKGDQISNSNQILLAEITDIVVGSAQKVTQNAAGDLLLRLDPLYKDVTFTVSVRTKTIRGETLIFDNVPLKIGETLPLNFPNISRFPLITNFTLNSK